MPSVTTSSGWAALGRQRRREKKKKKEKGKRKRKKKRKEKSERASERARGEKKENKTEILRRCDVTLVSRSQSSRQIYHKSIGSSSKWKPA